MRWGGDDDLKRARGLNWYKFAQDRVRWKNNRDAYVLRMQMAKSRRRGTSLRTPNAKQIFD